MAEIRLATGGYRYLAGVFQYSAGVAAEPGLTIERVVLRRALPLAEGFGRIAGHLEALGRPRHALCACELRSPAPFSESGFTDFNRAYVAVLEGWGLAADGATPVARSNVCPEIDPPRAPVFHAFSYTVPSVEESDSGGFIAAGSGEAREGQGDYAATTVRPGDLSPDGLRAKARFVLAEIERRIAALGFGWADVTATQLYTVHDIHPLLADEIVARGAAPAGLTWHFARPPVAGLDFEMDARGLARELVL
jgi:hypothetical protein